MGLNTIEVDPAALDHEAARILGEVPPELAAPAPSEELAGEAPAEAELTLEQLQTIAAGYQPAAFMLLTQASNILVPAWELSNDERTQLSSSVAFALAAWFPNQQLPPKYAALLGLAGAVYGIVESRRDPETGKIKPRRRDAKSTSTAVAASVSAEAA